MGQYRGNIEMIERAERIFEKFGIYNVPFIEETQYQICTLDFSQTTICMRDLRQNTKNYGGCIETVPFGEKKDEFVYNILNIHEGQARLLHPADLETFMPIQGETFCDFMRVPGEEAEEFYRFEDGSVSSEYRYEDLMKIAFSCVLNETRYYWGWDPLILIVGYPSGEEWKEKAVEYQQLLQECADDSVVIGVVSEEEALQAAYVDMSQFAVAEKLGIVDYDIIENMVLCGLKQVDSAGVINGNTQIPSNIIMEIHKGVLEFYGKNPLYECTLPIKVNNSVFDTEEMGRYTCLHSTTMKFFVKRAWIVKKMLEIAVVKMRKEHEGLQSLTIGNLKAIDGIYEYIWENIAMGLEKGKYTAFEIVYHTAKESFSCRLTEEEIRTSVEKGLSQMKYDAREYAVTLDCIIDVLSDRLIEILQVELEHHYENYKTLEKTVLRTYMRLLLDRYYHEGPTGVGAVQIPVFVNDECIMYEFRCNVARSSNGWYEEMCNALVKLDLNRAEILVDFTIPHIHEAIGQVHKIVPNLENGIACSFMKPEELLKLRAVGIALICQEEIQKQLCFTRAAKAIHDIDKDALINECIDESTVAIYCEWEKQFQSWLNWPGTGSLKKFVEMGFLQFWHNKVLDVLLGKFRNCLSDIKKKCMPELEVLYLEQSTFDLEWSISKRLDLLYLVKNEMLISLHLQKYTDNSWEYNLERTEYLKNMVLEKLKQSADSVKKSIKEQLWKDQQFVEMCSKAIEDIQKYAETQMMDLINSKE